MAIPSATDINPKVVYLNIINKERGKINMLKKNVIIGFLPVKKRYTNSIK